MMHGAEKLREIFGAVAADFERQRAARRRRLERAILAGLIACVVFAALSDPGTWPGRAAMALAVLSLAACLRAAALLRRT